MKRAGRPSGQDQGAPPATEQLQARRIEIETQMSDKKVDLVDLNTMTGYITEMHEVLSEGTLTERRAFIRSFVQEIKVIGNEALMTYSPPIPPERVALSGDTVPRIVHRGGPLWTRTTDLRDVNCLDKLDASHRES